MKCQAFCSKPGGWLVLLAPDGRGNHTGPGYVVERVRMQRQASYCLSHARLKALAMNREEKKAEK